MEVGRYRKRPVEVDAVHLVGDNSYVIEWITSNGGYAGTVGTAIAPAGAVAIQTREGTMIANQGDYVIRGVAGEFYPCAPEIFAQTYERA